MDGNTTAPRAKGGDCLNEPEDRRIAACPPAHNPARESSRGPVHASQVLAFHRSWPFAHRERWHHRAVTNGVDRRPAQARRQLYPGPDAGPPGYREHGMAAPAAALLR